MRSTTMAAAVAFLLAAGQADAQPRGIGSGYASAATAPVTKSAGPSLETQNMPVGDLPVAPRHGLFGAPGAAPDDDGPMRLGPHGERSSFPAFGEAPRTGAGAPAASVEGFDTWRSGDIVRSQSSAEVREARREQAPDLEWATTEAPGGNTRNEPQEPYGVKFQQEQEQPYRPPIESSSAYR